MTFEIRVISGVQAFVDAEPIKLRRQVQRLAAILVAAGPEGIEGSALAEELWVGDPPDRWNSAVRNAITELRAGAGREVVETSGGRYSLRCNIEQVDAWRVLREAASAETSAESVGHIGRFQPFNGFELTPLLSEMSEALHEARLQLLGRVTTVDDLDPTLIAGLIASVRADPFAESTAVAVIDLLVRVGRESDALQLLDDVEQAHRDELDADPAPALIRARQRIGGARDVSAVSAPSEPARSLPSVIADLAQRPMTPRHRQLARDAAGRITEPGRPKRWSVLGLAGCGKSRFVAEVGNRLHAAGTDVIFATAIGDESSAYSPFLTASSAFRRRYLDLVDPTEPAVWALWSSILEDLAARGRPLALIVDDAHRLDLLSIRLLQFTHRMQPQLPLTTIIVGRNSTHEQDWRSFERELLDDDRTVSLDVPRLDADDIETLINDRWPGVPELVSRDAAIEVRAGSAGLPMVAHLLIDSLTGPTLRLPRRHQSHQVEAAADRLSAFDAEARTVLAAATVLGNSFSADDIAVLVEREPDDVEAVLERAEKSSVLSILEVPGSYRFTHELLREAAVRQASKAERAMWSRQLMDTVDDPLRLARFAVVARELISPEVFAERLVAGAEAALDRNLTRRSVQLARLAMDVVTEADHRALCCLAIAEARLGSFDEAAAARQQLIDRCASPDDHRRATRTLIDSIPLVEIDDRASIRVEDFDKLETTDLDQQLRLDRAFRTARLAVNEGDPQRRDSEMALARSLQTTDNEAGRLLHAEWACESEGVDDAWFERLAELRERVDQPHVVALLTQIEALELAALGRWTEAEQSNESFRQVAEQIASAEMQWQSMLAAAGFAFARGDVPESQRIADEAFSYGMLFALPLAPAARAAQSFGAALYTGAVGTWLELVETMSPGLLRNFLAMAAVGRARFEVGRLDDAWQIAEPVLIRALEGERRIAVSVVAVLAPLIRKRASPAIRQQCIHLVREKADRWIITGAGFGIHGPATRTVAILEQDRRALQRLRHQLADRPLWASAIDNDIATIEQAH